MTVWDKNSPRGPMRAALALKMAGEGIPVAVIARLIGRDPADVGTQLAAAHEAGHLDRLPPADWGEQPAPAPADDQIQSEILARAPALQVAFSLSAAEARGLALIVSRPIANRAALHRVLRVRSDTGPKLVDVHVCRLRKALDPWGLRIETVWDGGYRMAPDHKAFVQEIVAERAGVTHAAA